MGTRLRACALVVAAALAVHQVRYLAAYGDGASRALERQGHGYLPLLFAVAGVLAAAGLLALLLALAARRPPAPPRALARRWLRAGLAVAAVYSCQELAEAALFPGHPGGLNALLAADGWIALLLAAAAGLVVALLARGADALLADRASRATRAHPAAASLPLPPSRERFAASVLATHLAGRGPPSFAG